jgi:hypothetical protein
VVFTGAVFTGPDPALVKGQRKAGPDTADKDYFVREVAYGGFERSFALPEGVDGAQVKARHAIAQERHDCKGHEARRDEAPMRSWPAGHCGVTRPGHSR